ncbi:MAG: hypothetical protein EP343_16495 [Deltaproteobacteria bacterium]|nr:MAG: hypothetical protein EP343_16495 [Deltaproteobacteria bacterium]
MNNPVLPDRLPDTHTKQHWRLVEFILFVLLAGFVVFAKPGPSWSQTSRPKVSPILKRSLPKTIPAPPKRVEGTNLRVVTQHFDFTFPARWKTWVSPILKHAEADFLEISQGLGYTSKNKLQVKFARSGRDFSKIQPFPWHPPSFIAGLAYPNQGVMTLRLQGTDGMAGLRQTFRHELSHLLLARAVHHKRLPLWFVEGLAMVQSQDFGALDRMWLLARTRMGGHWPKLSSLEKGFPANYEARRVAYAVSTDFVVYLRKLNPKVVPEALALIRKGKGFQAAIAETCGQSWSNLQTRWLKQVGFRYGWIVFLSQEWLLWFFAILLAIWGYFKLRRQRRKQLKQWAEEEDEDDDGGPWYPPSQRHLPYTR